MINSSAKYSVYGILATQKLLRAIFAGALTYAFRNTKAKLAIKCNKDWNKKELITERRNTSGNNSISL